MASRYEDSAGLLEAKEALEVDVSQIEDIDGARLGDEDVEHANVVRLAVGDPDEDRDVAPQGRAECAT